jgi:hypothetical protein
LTHPTALIVGGLTQGEVSLQGGPECWRIDFLPIDQLADKRRLDEVMAPMFSSHGRLDAGLNERGDGGLEAGVVGAIGAVTLPPIDELTSAPTKLSSAFARNISASSFMRLL